MAEASGDVHSRTYPCGVHDPWRQPDPSEVAALSDVLTDRRWLVLGGAGVSTDSGIPDYRGPGSVNRSPMTYQQFVSGHTMQQRYWARAHVGWARMKTAEPNATHQLLADLEAKGRLQGLITQNVDGLHQRAGHDDVIDLHGRIDRVVCLGCRALTSRAELHGRLAELNPGYDQQLVDIAPDGDAALDDTAGFEIAACTTCGGTLKPDVVFFGENVAKPIVERCFGLVDEAETLVVLGSSLQVMSGLRFVRAAHKRGIPIVIVNRGATRGDNLATLKLEAGCAETLTSWAGALAS